MVRDDETIRVYFASIDAETVGRVGYADVDIRDPSRVLGVSQRPVLEIGAPGMFDDNGVKVTSVVHDGDTQRMYYFGYQLGVRVRYFLLGGLALSHDGGETFARVQRVPLLERSDGEPLLRSAPFVLHGAGRWRMWYVAGERYVDVDGTARPTYEIRYAESEDGVAWPQEGRPAVALLQGSEEYGLGRPFVARHDDGFRMWYSVRTRNLGYREPVFPRSACWRGPTTPCTSSHGTGRCSTSTSWPPARWRCSPCSALTSSRRRRGRRSCCPRRTCARTSHPTNTWPGTNTR